jgi:plasmid stabilization system protein ParE
MRIRVLSSAEREIAEAADYYNGQAPGLGNEFMSEIRKALRRIVSFSGSCPRFSAKTRRCFLNRFPYGIVYQEREDHVVVMMVMHLKRDPRRWKETLKQRLGD